MNKMKMYRGDSFSTPVFINVGTKFHPVRYVLKDEDKLYVGIMEPNQPFEMAIVRKVLDKSDLNKTMDPVFKLKPEETENLIPAKYFIEAKLLTKEGTVVTAVPKEEFWILD